MHPSFLLRHHRQVLLACGVRHPRVLDNQHAAEYAGLVGGPRAAVRDLADTFGAMPANASLPNASDSQLVIYQMSGGKKIKSARLQLHHHVAVGPVRQFAAATCEHILRAPNTRSNALANAAHEGRCKLEGDSVAFYSHPGGQPYRYDELKQLNLNQQLILSDTCD
jgi:hypothetical protein